MRDRIKIVVLVYLVNFITELFNTNFLVLDELSKFGRRSITLFVVYIQDTMMNPSEVMTSHQYLHCFLLLIESKNMKHK
jgi:hypothetical protein